MENISMNENLTATIDRGLTDKTYGHYRHSDYNTKTEYFSEKDMLNYEQPVPEISSKSWLDDFGWL